MSVKPHREKAVVTQPPTRRKNRVQADKDNTLKGVAERLKSVKPHGTKKAPRKALSKCSQMLRTEPDQNGR